METKQDPLRLAAQTRMHYLEWLAHQILLPNPPQLVLDEASQALRWAAEGQRK
jgi:hypothetical protein